MIEPDQLNELTSSHGAPTPSHGMVSGVTAPSRLFLGVAGVFTCRSQG